MLTKELIEERINKFWGYGNINSDIWFIGMEEGGQGTDAELENRFMNTKHESIIDIQTNMKNVKGHMDWFSSNSNIQRTWSKLILILLTLKSDNIITNDKIKEFQRKEFGRLNSNHCSLEFMPLPCRSIKKKDWFYDKFEINYLKSRKEYIKKIMPVRIRLFQELIKKHNPKMIICYSFSYLKKWKEIIGCRLVSKENIHYCKKNNTHFFVIPHSTAWGMRNDEWIKIAQTIKQISHFP